MKSVHLQGYTKPVCFLFKIWRLKIHIKVKNELYLLTNVSGNVVNFQNNFDYQN